MPFTAAPADVLNPTLEENGLFLVKAQNLKSKMTMDDKTIIPSGDTTLDSTLGAMDTTGAMERTSHIELNGDVTGRLDDDATTYRSEKAMVENIDEETFGIKGKIYRKV